MKRVLNLRAEDEEKIVEISVKVRSNKKYYYSLTRDEFNKRANSIFDSIAEKLMSHFNFTAIKRKWLKKILVH